MSQIGYVLLGLALFTGAGLAAMVFFLVQYVLVKAALLMWAGVVEHSYGTGELDRLGGSAARHPALAVAFAVSALSLAGIPPLSGFVGKLALVRAATLDASWLAVALAVVVSALTLLSMLKVWNGVFRGPAPDGPPGGTPVRVLVRGAGPALALAGLSVALGVWAQPLLSVSGAAAAGLIDSTAYVRAVTAR